MRYDAIIIGGGLGGLVAGAKLAKHGKKVLLIEQHSIPGGCATVFKRKDFTFEVGLHEMDGLHSRDMKTKIFRDLGVFDEVEFLKVPEFYRFINDKYNIVIPHDPQEATDILLKHFPEEKVGIDAYFDQLLNARKKIKQAKGKKENNLGEFLDGIIKNDDLKLILLGNLGYFHDNPYSMSLSYYSVAQGSYYAGGGGNFIKGGSQKLSDYFADFILKNDGKILYKHIVTDIIVENNTATGVIYKKNTRKETESIKVFAENIIANAAMPNIANQLLPSKYGQELDNQIKNRTIGSSLLSIYFGFNKNLKELGNKYYSTFVYDKSVKTQADIYLNNKSDYKTRSYTFIDYSQVDAELAPKDKSVGVMCCIDNISDWDKLTKDEYRNKKAQIFISRLNELIPGIKQYIEYYEVGTSKTIERYTLNPQGAVYGFAQLAEGMPTPKIESIENLYFASAWAETGGGFSGAMYAGYFCAYSIIRKKKVEITEPNPKTNTININNSSNNVIIHDAGNVKVTINHNKK